MLQGVLITDESGELLIERYFTVRMTRREVEPILKLIKSNKGYCPPFVSSFGTVFVVNHARNVYVIGVTDEEKNTITVAVLLDQIVKMLDETMSSALTLETLKMDYSIAYVVIDQFIDSGFPFLDELNLISSSMIQNGNSLNVDIRSPWRAQPVIKNTQDIRINVQEEMFSHINSQGKSENLFVKGKINMASKLADPPNVNLTYSVPGKIDDFTFHRCVDPSLHLSRKLQFIPPDGEFTLMNYQTQPKISNLPLFIVPKFSWSMISVLFEISLRIDPIYISTIRETKIRFSLPKGVSQPSLAVASGDVHYFKHDNLVVWDVDPSAKKELLSMGGSASIAPGFNRKACQISIFIDFVIDGVSISSLKIDSLELINGQKCTKTINYSTAAGHYIFDVD